MIGLDERPKLRWPLDIQSFEAEGERYVALRDEMGVAEEPAIIPVGLLPIVSRLDGNTQLKEILAEGAPHGLTAELLAAIVRDLEKLSYLDTKDTRARWDSIRKDYANAAVREAAHAGRVYPKEPEELETLINGYLDKTKDDFEVDQSMQDVVSVVCPHIDYRRGWQTYCAAYQILEKVETPDVIFLIGTSHHASERLFHLTTKDFQIPSGCVSAEKEAVERIASRYGKGRCLKDEILHRKEHSLELQLPFLFHRFREKMPTVVPILVGSFHQYFHAEKAPGEDAEVSDFVEALADEIKFLNDEGKKVLFYGGIDLSHVGQHFGDSERVSDGGLEELTQRDHKLIEAITNADEDALFSHMAEDHDKRRVCGYPSMYTMFSTMRNVGWNLKGQCVDYRQAVDEKSDCIVTFTSMCWTKQ